VKTILGKVGGSGKANNKRGEEVFIHQSEKTKPARATSEKCRRGSATQTPEKGRQQLEEGACWGRMGALWERQGLKKKSKKYGCRKQGRPRDRKKDWRTMGQLTGGGGSNTMKHPSRGDQKGVGMTGPKCWSFWGNAALKGF